MDFLGSGYAVLAAYKKQIIPEYQGNPLIEALPPILSEEEAVELLGVYPKYHEQERQLEPQYRYHCVQRLFRYFQPLGQHIDLEQRFSRIIRQGYLGRNPATKDYVQQLQRRLNQESNYDIRTTATGFALIGISGIGKTTAIERVLSLYPQVIVHQTPLNLYQLVWLKLDCPFDGSLKGLCINFFLKVDGILGTIYYNKFGTNRKSVDSMLAHMEQVASLHCIGVLIIDEIQHLSLAKSGGSDRMLNFFVTLVNTIGLPVVLIGTMKARSIFQSAFRQARRGTGQGDMTWYCIEKDENWDLLLDGMWAYQWLQRETILTDELREVFYEESQGIIDIAIKLYILAQTRAISIGIEQKISPEIIRQVAKDSLQSVQPMLQALRTGDLLELAKYEDIYPVDVDKQLEKYARKLNLTQLIHERKAREAEKRNIQSENMIEKLVLAMLNLEIEAGVAQRIAKKVLQQVQPDTSFPDIIKLAVSMAFNLSVNEVGNTKENIEKDFTNNKIVGETSHDMRNVVKLGKKKKVSAYDALKTAGYIKSPLRDFAIEGAIDNVSVFPSSIS